MGEVTKTTPGEEPPAIVPQPPEPEDDEVEASRAPLLDHLYELRNRLLVVVAAIGVAFVGCFFFAEPIYNFLVIPFDNEASKFAVDDNLSNYEPRMIFTGPLEFFFVKLKLALFGAIIVAFPVISYNIYRFIAPGLYNNERSAFLPFMIASPLLFLAGAALVFYFILPFVMSFALNQQQIGDGTINIEMLTRVSEYLSLVTTLILAFGFSFQLPVVLTLLGMAGLVTSKMLIGGFRYAVVGVFAFAMFVTPPDPISQVGLGLAVLGLYAISILCVRAIEKKHEEEERAAQ